MKNIKDLYQNRLKDINYYNKDNFEIREIPIELYLEKSKNLNQNTKKDNDYNLGIQIII